MAQREAYDRFSVSQRVQHWAMVVSFTLLAVTGLPQRYAQSAVAETLIGVLGGIEMARIVHRGAAIVFILVTMYHFWHLLHKIFVLRARPSMLPAIRDFVDFLAAVRYNLCLSQVRPKLPRYNFMEKIEYWSLVWGSALMIVTGFLLWNPVTATRVLPGEFIPAAKMAHSAEALLAVLAVIIWHFYSVHLKHFNRSMFSGKLSRHEMEEEHSAELEELESGALRFPEPRGVVRRRERIFLPTAVVAGGALVVGLYWFVSSEQTAITTISPAVTVQAYVPASPTPTLTPTVTPTATNTPIPTSTPTGAPTAASPAGAATAEARTLLSLMVIPHPLEGREDCLMCHGEGKIDPYPPDHVGRPSSTCLICHGTTEAEEHLPAVVKHDLEGRSNCLMCHAVDLLPVSHKTAGFSNSDCLLCHVPIGASPGVGAGGTPIAPAADATPTSAAPAGVAGDIPHALAGREDCQLCHGLTGVSPYPPDHEGRPNATCVACHKEQPAPPSSPEAAPTETEQSAAAGVAAPIPHELAGREDCLLCHGLTGVSPYPPDHEGRPNVTCVACHPQP